MKTKLTLTVKKSIIEAAKRKAKNKGISLSRMFEGDGENEIKTEAQRAAERLIKKLGKSQSITSLEDKDLIKEHVKRKFA
jgi:hypothetical protein